MTEIMHVDKDTKQRLKSFLINRSSVICYLGQKMCLNYQRLVKKDINSEILELYLYQKVGNMPYLKMMILVINFCGQSGKNVHKLINGVIDIHCIWKGIKL